MRIIRGLSFFLEGECFAVDVTRVRKVARKMEMTPVPAAPDEVAGIVNLKGKVVTLLNLSVLLRRKDGAGEASVSEDPVRRPLQRGMQTVNAVIFKPSAEGGDETGLIVDRFGDWVEIDESRTAPPPLTEETADDFPVSGVYGSGMLYRILDVDSVTAGRFGQ